MSIKACAALCSCTICIHGLLTDEHMGVLFRSVLEKLHIYLKGNKLPAHVKALLQYISGVPGRMHMVLAALAGSNDSQEFQRSKLILGLRLTENDPERYSSS